ncbi:MAG: hypothetical protein R2862_03180 [Thermoanaerobaculia bacterium]
MRQAILWDNDGVLVDSEELFYEANRRFFAAHGLEISLDLYLEHFLRRSAGVWHLFRERGWSEEGRPRARGAQRALRRAPRVGGRPHDAGDRGGPQRPRPGLPDGRGDELRARALRADPSPHEAPSVLRAGRRRRRLPPGKRTRSRI